MMSVLELVNCPNTKYFGEDRDVATHHPTHWQPADASISFAVDQETSFHVVSRIDASSGASVPSNNGQADELFLDSTYHLSTNHQVREAVGWIIDKLDDLINADELIRCNKILYFADPFRLSDPLIVTFLGITLAAKSKLPSRGAFYQRASQIVSERRGDEGAAKLLDKYR